MGLKSFLTQASLCFTVVLGSYNCFAQDTETKEKIKADILKRIPGANTYKFKEKYWGAVWAFSKAKGKFKDSIAVKSTYLEGTKWKNDIWYLKKEGTPQIILDKVPNSEETIHNTSYLESKDGFKHYEVELKSGRFALFDSEFNELQHGPLNDGVRLTEDLKKKINKQLINPQIVKAWRLDKDHIFFSVIFETENGHNNPGQIIFTNNGEWVKTIHHLENYFRLPLELLIYVNDNDGLKNFGNIKKIESKELGTFYKVRHKDGQEYRMDVDLNRL